MSEEKRKASEMSGGEPAEPAAKRTKISEDLAQQIKKQVEFYFSDSNYPRDKFLRAHAALNEEGYVDLDTLLTFNRMKELCTDREIVAEVLRDSQLVKVNPEGTKIKRIAPVPEKDPLKDRSVYVSGFPVEMTFEEIQQFFSKYFPVNSVRIIRNKDTNQSSGAAYVEFASPDSVDKILAQTIKYNSTELSMMKKDDYLKQKNKGESKKGSEKEESGKKEEGGKETTKGEKGKGGKKDKQKKEKGKNDDYPKGTIVKLSNIDEKIDRETIKSSFAQFGSVAFVELAPEKKEAYLRFNEAAEASKAVSEFKGPLANSTPTLKLMEGEEEKTYWEKVRSGKPNKKGKKSKRGKKKN
jgi:lupus La protein